MGRRGEAFPASLAAAGSCPDSFLPDCYFRFGLVRACVRTDDPDFRGRFHRNFRDCAELPAAPENARTTRLQVATSVACDAVVAEMERLEDDPIEAILDRLFPELDIGSAKFEASDGWRCCRVPGVVDGLFGIGVQGSKLAIRRDLPWQKMLAHLFLNQVMRLQPETLFFHGAAVDIEGNGALLAGEKGSGKSTLSLALAAHGHGFLADEIAAVHQDTKTLLPFRRQASIRCGPQAESVTRFLGANDVERETLPDGTWRYRESVSRMFPQATARQVPLTDVFFLRRRTERPHVQSFQFSTSQLALAAPLHATLMGENPGVRVMSLLKLFSATRCHFLEPGGTPDETAELIAAVVMKGKAWATA